MCFLVICFVCYHVFLTMAAEIKAQIAAQDKIKAAKNAGGGSGSGSDSSRRLDLSGGNTASKSSGGGCCG